MNDTLTLKIKINGIWKIKLIKNVLKAVLWFINLKVFDKKQKIKNEWVLNLKIDFL